MGMMPARRTSSECWVQRDEYDKPVHARTVSTGAKYWLLSGALWGDSQIIQPWADAPAFGS